MIYLKTDPKISFKRISLRNRIGEEKIPFEYIENCHKYHNSMYNIINFDSEKIKNLIAVSDILLKTNNLGKKTIIFGNGGSAAIASHFSVDLTKNARVRCVNYNESDLLTCFSNDFGYENWVQKAIEFYADKDDILILISSNTKLLKA